MMKKIVAYFYVSIFTKIDITIIKGYGSNHRCIFFILLFYTASRSIVLQVHPRLAGIKSVPSISYSRYSTSTFAVCKQDRKIKVAVYRRNETPNLRTDFFNKIKNIVTALLSIAGM